MTYVRSEGAYEFKQFSNIGLARSERNLVDRLTKEKMGKALYYLYLTDLHEIKVEQWIIRDPA